MRRRTLNPNASHSHAAALVTSEYASTGITVARGIDLFDSIVSPFDVNKKVTSQQKSAAATG
jgi:hypothetical protein